MPGISVMCDLRASLKPDDERAVHALGALHFDERYTSKTILADSTYFLATTSYPQYPIVSFDGRDVLAVVEGRIYGKEPSVLERELQDLGQALFSGDDEARARLARWVLEADGEFAIFLLHKPTRSAAIFNDVRGMLPLYYCRQGDRLLVSRELGFLSAMMDDKKIDRMGVAQCLLFSYCLNEKTFYQGVSRLAGGSVIGIRPAERAIDVRVLNQFNFDHREHAGKSLAENCERLTDLLVESCRTRCDSTGQWTNVFSISGGVDSRLVGVGLRAAGISCQAVTFLDPDNRMRGDVDIGSQLAKILGYHWQSFVLTPPTGKDMLKLLRMRYGMNYLAMGFILPFFQQLRQMMGPDVIYVTGDTGMALRGVAPRKPLRDVDQLMGYILANDSLLDVPLAAGLLGMKASDIRDNLRAHLEAYPEQDLRNKYVHFYLTQRGFVWHHDGMDRNRYFFPLATPLESMDLFRYLMNCPESQKVHYRMFAEMFRRLSPEAAALDEQGHKAPPGTLRFAINDFLKSLEVALYRKAPRWGKNLARKVILERKLCDPKSTITKCLRHQLRHCQAVSDVLDPDQAEDIVNNSGKIRLQLLFTISSAIELFREGTSSIEPYAESVFT